MKPPERHYIIYNNANLQITLHVTLMDILSASYRPGLAEQILKCSQKAS